MFGKMCLVFCVAWGLATAAAADQPVLAIATGEYAPFTDSNAADGGVVNAQVAAIAEAAGYRAVFDYMPWMRALELTRNGRFPVSSYWYQSDERAVDFIHVGPIVQDDIVFFHRADMTLPDWSTLSDLADLRIGAVTGYTYTPGFWDAAAAGTINVQTAQTDEANLRKLLAGRIDVYPMSATSGFALIAENFTPEEQVQFDFDDKPMFSTDGFLLVSRQLENAENLAAELQAAVDGLTLASR